MPSLQSYHTFGLSASSQQITPFSDITSFFAARSQYTSNYLLGGGSNTIFLKDFEGQVLINRILGIEHTETAKAHELRVGAGENWHELVATCVKNGWYGLENLALIPGSVGACPIQNIGAYGVEVETFISSVEGVAFSDKAHFELSAQQCQFGYRDSVFKHDLAGETLITHVNFSLPKQNEVVTTYGELAALESPTPDKIFEEVIRIRKAKLPDPAQFGNAGSFFKNPIIENHHYAVLSNKYNDVPGYAVGTDHTKVPAAWLIDKLGFKGRAINGVRCHPTQPLVLTNTGGATGKDLVSLAREIMLSVQGRFSITLEPEVRLVGKEGLIEL
ncbi:UDP-N-acetylmuramate dehydrogenase [Alteromonas sp. H39]|uniref:UDP-N-acetylmuramate dehydrogenase n=1 Tax=Alteromonas sp. H39 TaxID=3389876 RepID=UPI0039E0CB7D